MALLPPFVIKTVVAIGNRPEPNADVNWIATGFFYGTPLAGFENQYRVYLVTNRHVALALTDGVVRVNTAGSAPPREFSLPPMDPQGDPTWKYHPNPEIDISVAPVVIDFTAPENEELSFFQAQLHSSTSSEMQIQEQQEGDGVFLLGFPMGLIGSSERNAVIVRGGCIARIRDLYDGTNTSFLVDSWVFPGNSGGPVVSKPEAMSIEGTRAYSRADLIGVAAGFLTYSDVAISQQSQKPRVVFEENAGLAVVYPVERIQEIISEYEATHPLPAPPEPEIIEVEEDDPVHDVPPPTLPPDT